MKMRKPRKQLKKICDYPGKLFLQFLILNLRAWGFHFDLFKMILSIRSSSCTVMSLILYFEKKDKPLKKKNQYHK